MPEIQAAQFRPVVEPDYTAQLLTEEPNIFGTNGSRPSCEQRDIALQSARAISGSATASVRNWSRAADGLEMGSVIALGSGLVRAIWAIFVFMFAAIFGAWFLRKQAEAADVVEIAPDRNLSSGQASLRSAKIWQANYQAEKTGECPP